jgi:hypothetical protein
VLDRSETLIAEGAFAARSIALQTSQAVEEVAMEDSWTRFWLERVALAQAVLVWVG